MKSIFNCYIDQLNTRHVSCINIFMDLIFFEERMAFCWRICCLLPGTYVI